MDIRSSLDGLKSLLGTTQTAQVSTDARSTASTTTPSALESDSATLSSAAAQVSQTAADEGVRMDKVTAIQSALSSGSYNVAASVVATKLVDSMMAGA